MISSLVNRLRHDYPEILFTASSDFRWSPGDKTVYYRDDADEADMAASLLHETAHALLSHTDFTYDINLLKLEREAWTYAKDNLALPYKVEISESTVEQALDSYRDWLHGRSACPDCRQNGIQNPDQSYTCVACGQNWRANDARRCALRRYKTNK